jgi:hypothetical protein
VLLDLDCQPGRVENTNLISIEDLKCFLEVLDSLINQFEDSLNQDPDGFIVINKNKTGHKHASGYVH